MSEYHLYIMFENIPLRAIITYFRYIIFFLFSPKIVLCYFARVFLAVTKQLYKHFFLSVRLSVCLWCFFHCHRIIMKFSEVITIDRSDVHAKGQGQRSKVKVTEVMAPLSRFQTVTPVWINIWQWNDVQSLMLLRRCALLFFKVIR